MNKLFKIFLIAIILWTIVEFAEIIQQLPWWLHVMAMIVLLTIITRYIRQPKYKHLLWDPMVKDLTR